MAVGLAELTVAFAVGLWVALSLPALPAESWIPVCGAVALLLAGFGWRWRQLWLLAAVLVGFSHGLLSAQQALDHRLPLACEGRDALLTGVVADLPQADGRRTRLRLDVQRLTVDGRDVSGPRRVLLSWYGEHPPLRAGQRWQLPVRLKAPRGFHNPSGFDYARWLTQQGIDATGYVRPGPALERLPDHPLHTPVQRVRQHIADGLSRHLGDDDAGRLVRGLAIGVTGAISPATWRTVRETGTAHLLAISGLHVALSGLFAYTVVARLWRLWPGGARRVPAPRAAAVAAALAVFGYAALAGFAVPARRTALMFSVAALGAASGRETSPWRLWLLAALVVLLLDPLALLASGFWLSFGAVGILLWQALGRVAPQRPAADTDDGTPVRPWRARAVRLIGAVRLQVAVTLALTPLTLAFFGLLSPTAVPANLLAVPSLGLLAVPLTLLGTVALPVPWLAGPLLDAAHGVCATTLAALHALVQLAPGRLWPPLPGWTLLAALVGVLLLLMPRGVPGRWLGLVWLLPAVLWWPALPAPGNFVATVLDVGQGLAVVVRTQRHMLVYDSGPRYSERFSAGEAIVLPELARLGARQVDLLLLSHGDADHAGAAADIVDGIPTKQVITGTPEQIVLSQAAGECRDGAQWQWDGVRLAMYAPGAGLPGASDNDRSCVLLVSGAAGQRLLLTGDIERPAQRRLLAAGLPPGPLAAVVAPHHGSRSALYRPLIDALAAREVVFSAGYRNRFGHPHPRVAGAYRRAGARIWNTARDGAVQLRTRPDGLQVMAQRELQRRWWRAGH